MRYLLSLSAIIFGAVLLVIAAGQRAILGGPANIEVQSETVKVAEYVVIPGEELAKINGKPHLSAGHNVGAIATGSLSDVTAWAAPYGYTKLVVDPESNRLTSETVAPAADEKPDPNFESSDLWRSYAGFDGSTAFESTIIADENEAAIVYSDTAEDKAATPIDLKWEQVRYTPWVGPFLTAGGFFLLLGIVLYIVFVDRDRRGLGPRRGRRGPLVGIRNMFKRKKPVNPRYSGGSAMQRVSKFTAVGVLSALALTGCSAELWPQRMEEKADVVSEALPPTVAEEQIARILKDISAVATAADEGLDAGGLEARFSGDALNQRRANYAIRNANADYNLRPPFITTERLGYELVQHTSTWPRSILMTVASSDTAPDPNATQISDSAEDTSESVETAPQSASPSLALLLTQENAHAPFKVRNIVSLRGGQQMPAAAPADEGTALLDNETELLTVKPAELGGLYAAALVEGVESEAAANFETVDDVILTRGGAAWVAAENERTRDSQGKATFSVRAEQAGEPTAISTGTGGALVVLTVNELRTTAADDDSELPISDTIAAISDLEGAQRSITQIVAHQLLFYVPRVGSEEKILLLGSTSELVGASK
ncbi:glycosyltransferase [Canibacter zhoujuaniae]|uniref:glycosyltransferase n=1 Tax=Canibacter zhoujuaniae TaxID=2708343 RepID=UPI00141ED9AD|nr:glycosyltransferase [Canibacter zhoujuaniae]